MSIRLKIILVVLPLVIVTLLLTGVSSYFSATTGITRIARDFLGFKAQELRNNAESQWGLLVDNGLTGRPDMVEATRTSVETYARGLVRSPTEIVFAVDPDGKLAMASSALALRPGEASRLAGLARQKSTDLVTIPVAGRERVAKGFWFEPFGWYLLVSEERAVFFARANEITVRTAIILGAAVAATVVLVLLLARYLGRPISRVAAAMKDIIFTSDLSGRVAVEYDDEVGRLAGTFNHMVASLEKAHAQINTLAYNAVIARKREQKIRNIFQKYVPKDVIDQHIKNPEGMLVGENRVLAVLSSDIRSFTSIAEALGRPDVLVESLNRYFTAMVDVIVARKGTIDKYIGDAIVAFFGAPERHEDDAQSSVRAGLEMLQALAGFNEAQKQAGKPEFHIGVGINYGVVTIGNMGSDKKMTYTVIGESVTLASDLEALTKTYHEQLIISESLQKKVASELPCRLLGWVRLESKGRSRTLAIYTARAELSPREKEAWEYHAAAMAEYRKRNFKRAITLLDDVARLLPGDGPAELLAGRCREYLALPLTDAWDGTDAGARETRS
jgi:class 3 adenylate cyclase/HAMP domain-containing protein